MPDSPKPRTAASLPPPRPRGRPPRTLATGGAVPREHLLNCALALVHERGYQAMSLGDLAQRAGFNKGLITHYFSSKQAVLEAVAERRIALLLEGLNQGMERATDAHSRASLAMRHLLNHVASQESELMQWGCPLGGLALECGRLAAGDAAFEVGQTPLRQMQAWLTEQLRPAMGRQAAKRQAESVMVRLQGATLLSQVHRDPGPLRRQIAELRAAPLP